MTMTVTPVDIAGTVKRWVEEQARERNVTVTIYSEAIKANGSWLHVPVAIESNVGNAYEEAVLLQQIEDGWNDAPPLNGLFLLLVPASRKSIDRQERYEQVDRLLERQRQILARMSDNGMTQENWERFAAIRQEWAETLDEMVRLFPALRH